MTAPERLYASILRKTRMAKILTVGKDGTMRIPKGAIRLLKWKPKNRLRVEVDTEAGTITITEAHL